MSTYATGSDVTNYIEGWVTDDAPALERLIRRCEVDIDRVVRSSALELMPTQVISLVGATSGTLTVTWNGTPPVSAPPVAFNASGATLQAALQSLAALGTNVTVIGDYPVWTLVWAQQLGDQFPSFNIPLVTVASTNGQATVETVPARKLDPVTDLDVNQARMLANATCAQVEYRTAMGSKFFLRGQYKTVRGPDFTTTGKLPYVGPRVLLELTGSGLLLTGGRAVVTRRRRGVAIGWPTF